MMNKLMRLLLIIAIVTLTHRLLRQNIGNVDHGHYSCLLFGGIVNILSEVDIFKKYTRLDPHIFLHYVWYPLKPHLNISREHFMVHDNQEHRRRRTQLPNIFRTVRALMCYAGYKMNSLVLIFNQTNGTISMDVKFIGQLIVATLYDGYVYCPTPGSPAYYQTVGSGVFEGIFPHTCYSLDVVKVRIPRPVAHQRDYFDGHHGHHAFGYLCMVNGFGEPVYVYGPYEGRINDITYYTNCAIYREPLRFLLPNDLVFADRIFRYFPPPIVTPYCGLVVFTLYQLLFNFMHAHCRVLVENFFGRLKSIWRIFLYYPYSLQNLDIHWRACIVLTAIIIKHQDPLRRV
eukprot:6446_1